MNKDNKPSTTTKVSKPAPKSNNPTSKSPAVPPIRKKFTINASGFQKKLSSLAVNNLLEGEPDYEKLPSLSKVKRAREKQKTKYKPSLTSSSKIIRDVDIPIKITVQELASRMSEKTGDVIKSLMKSGIMATANQYIDGDTAELIVAEVGYKGRLVFDNTKPDGTKVKLLDISKIISLGWSPKIQLQTGIIKTINEVFNKF